MQSPGRSPSNASPSQRASTGYAIRRGDIKISDPIPFTYNASTYGTTEEGQERGKERLDVTWPRKSAPSALQIRRGSSSQAEGIVNTRASAGPSIVASTMSSAPSKNSIVQKKSNGLRATIKRMFGSKRHNPTVHDSRSNYHQSDPGNLTLNRETQREHNIPRASSSRKLSVPHYVASDTQDATEPVPGLPSPDPVLMIHRRRNTLPSVILSDEEAQALAARFTSPRPAKRTTTNPYKEDTTYSLQLKRRSRSADALTEIAYAPDISSPKRQDRNGEIAYWRNSILVNPIPDLNLTRSTDPSEPIENKKSTATDKATQQHVPPFESFDFGLGVGDTESASLDQRVNTLEVKMFDFEYALAKLQGNSLPKPILPLRTKKRRPIHEVFPTNSFPSSMTSSGTNETTFLSSPGHSPITPLDDEQNIRADRGSKATTIKPEERWKGSGRSHTPSPSSLQVTSSQVETLLGLIRDEKVARQQMEMQILDLQKELEYLRTPIFASIQPSHYTTSGPESPRSKPLHRSPRFEFQKPSSVHETSRFSMTESELETDTEDGFQEVFETPQENQFAFETPRAAPLVGMI